MASNRITKCSVNWIEIVKRVPEAQKPKFIEFKAKSSGYLRKMLSFPDEPPEIDWSRYRNEITVPGLVDNFEKCYKAIKIPYPEDKYTGAICEYEKKTLEEIEEFKADAAEIIKKAEKRIEEINCLLPFNEMTFEDAAYEQPELTLDLENKPSFWPHGEIDYVFDEPPESENAQIEEQKQIDSEK